MEWLVRRFEGCRFRAVPKSLGGKGVLSFVSTYASFPRSQEDDMRPKTKANVSKAITAKARQVLQFAESKAKEVEDWLELHFALFGVDGKASELFPTEAERAAFLRTAEYKRINALMNTLPHPKKNEMRELVSSANGAISVRLPRSVHAALLAEAKAEGVSLNQLCVAKLIAQLRAVV